MKAEAPVAAYRTSIRVRYAETDAMGWVYYGNYFSFFEVGRTELIRTLWRPYRELESEGLRLPVIETGCCYYRGAMYDDLLTIETKLTLPSPVRLRFDYSVLRSSEESALAEGFSVHCFVGSDGKPVRIPADIMSLLSR